MKGGRANMTNIQNVGHPAALRRHQADPQAELGASEIEEPDELRSFLSFGKQITIIS